MHTQHFFFPCQLAFVNASSLVGFCRCELLGYCVYYPVFLSCFILSSEHKHFRLIFQAVSSVTIHLTWALLPFPLLPYPPFSLCLYDVFVSPRGSTSLHSGSYHSRFPLALIYLWVPLRVSSFLTIPAYWLIQNHWPISLY